MLIRSDARHIPLADESVHCVVTSPPYWGLRAYEGNPGMIGLEPTFEEHLENLVEVFREVRRVLRPDGTLWLNYGDAYAGGGRGTNINGKQGTNKGTYYLPPERSGDRKPKDLMMMPARVAIALQADGWWLRSEIIWHKPNPMPESVTDRPTSSHEKVFILTKSARYFYDAEAVRVPCLSSTPGKGEIVGTPGQSTEHDRRHDFVRTRSRAEQAAIGANLRNVWKIPTQGVKESHFATFPEKLVEPCIKAGSRTGDVVLDPFAGSGTVVRVAERFNRHGIGCDLDYQDIAKKRTSKIQRRLI